MSDTETRLTILETRYTDLLSRVIEHMDREEKERGADRKTLNDIYELIRETSNKADDKAKAEYKDWQAWANEKFETKVESSRTRWVATGISLGISLSIAIVGLVWQIKG